MKHIHCGFLLAGAVCFAAITEGGPLSACATQFQYSCASATFGGYTVITPLSAIGQTEITGYNQSNVVIFDQIIPAPPTGPAGVEVGDAVLQADAQLAVLSGQAGTLPACTPSFVSICLAPDLATTIQINASITNSYVAQDTAVSQRADQYSTTLIAKLNGSQVFSQTFALPFSDPAVIAAILTADGILTGDGATFGAPSLRAGSTGFLGSQLSYVQTGRTVTGNTFATTSNTFGPAAAIGCYVGCGNFMGQLVRPDLTFASSGQLIIDVNNNIEFAIHRNVITTNSFLTTQTYEIDGTTSNSNTPEPASWALMLAGVGAVSFLRTRRIPRAKAIDKGCA